MILETVKSTHTAQGFVADGLLNQYLNQARINLAAGGGLSEQELVAAVLSDLSFEAAAEKIRFGDGAPLDMSFRMYSQLLGYILLVLVIMCVTNITMVFRRPDIRMRNLCSPIKPRSLGGQQMLGGAVLSVFAWLLLTVVGFIMYGANLGGIDGRTIVLVLLNSLIFSIVAMSLASLCGLFARSANAQNAVANIFALGLCFLGGVFIPLDMLGDGILVFSRFLPTFWYVTALDGISSLTSFGAGAMAPVWQAMLIQLAFAAALFCVTLVVGKHQNQSEKFFSSIKTEIEA
jgi:ABC-2 type transport system permease protein